MLFNGEVAEYPIYFGKRGVDPFNPGFFVKVLHHQQYIMRGIIVGNL